LEKIIDQPFRAIENVSFLDVVLVAVIAFRALIVVADYALARMSVKEPVLERMTTPFDRLWKLPDNDFKDCAVIKVDSVPVDQSRLNVGKCANTSLRCQVCQRRKFWVLELGVTGSYVPLCGSLDYVELISIRGANRCLSAATAYFDLHIITAFSGS
jgi:hypothetical protein